MFSDIQYALMVQPLNVVCADAVADYQRALAAGEECPYFDLPDYTALIDSMNFVTLLRIDDDGFSGDSRLLLQHGDYYGVLIFGWGSCSGCDALQGCDTPEEVEALRKGMFDDIKWGSALETLTYMREHDWEGDFSWHADETKQFIAEATDMMARIVAANG